jgi:hypothetical protein
MEVHKIDSCCFGKRLRGRTFLNVSRVGGRGEVSFFVYFPFLFRTATAVSKEIGRTLQGGKPGQSDLFGRRIDARDDRLVGGVEEQELVDGRRVAQVPELAVAVGLTVENKRNISYFLHRDFSTAMFEISDYLDQVGQISFYSVTF